MAGGSLLVLLDDIALLMDDVGTMTKVAATKTSGVLGDDLALNAEQVSGMPANRELPVVWAVAKGSFVNKCILVPLALALSSYAPVFVPILLLIGGAYLCFEGAEKLAHQFLHNDDEKKNHHDELLHAIKDEHIDMVQFEKEKIKGAVRTDFVLSAEVIVISLGTLAADLPLLQKSMVLALVGIMMTIGVYGLVGLIVKLDDMGVYLSARKGLKRIMGAFLLWFSPRLMKTLTVVGTAAMFLVGGGIIAHSLPFMHHLVDTWTAETNSAASAFISTVFNAVVGLVSGAIVLMVVTLLRKVAKLKSKTSS